MNTKRRNKLYRDHKIKTKRAAGILLSALLCACLLGGCAGTGKAAEESAVLSSEEIRAESADGATETAALSEEAGEEPAPEEKEEKAEMEETAEAEEKTEAEAEEEKAGTEEAENEAGTDPAAGTTEAETTTVEQAENPQLQSLLESMSLEAKVAQMFVLLPEQLTGMGQVVQAGEATKAALEAFPVGGLIYMEGSLESYAQTKQLLSDTQQLSLEVTGLPMLTFVDEEGGIVTRVSGIFPEVPWIDSMAVYGVRADTEEAFQIGQTIGTYLSDLGFNCDCAPDADVLTNPYNTVIGERSFGSDPNLVSAMAAALGSGLESTGVTAVYKHFPGHGGTAEDTHAGYACLDKTMEELYDCELIPFIAAIENGAKMIMAAHISLPNATSTDLPASLNPEILTDLLRNQLGFQGLIITDAMNMGAVANQFSSGEAAILAISAGADLVLMPADPYSAYYAVLEAVNAGTISEERINESVRRILELKLG